MDSSEIEIPPVPGEEDFALLADQLTEQVTQLVQEGLGDQQPYGSIGVRLDPSAWPIVHGSRGSTDHTTIKQPSGRLEQTFHLYNSQEVQDEEETNGLYVGHLLTQTPTTSPNPRLFDEAGALLDFSVVDANAVSVITEHLSETESRLWTSTIGHIMVFRQLLGRPGLQRLAVYDCGRNFRFHGSYAFVASNGTETAFFAAMQDGLARFILRGSDRSGWHIIQQGLQPLPSAALLPLQSPQKQQEQTQGGRDHLVGLTLLDDGTIIASSKKGLVMASRLNEDGDFVLLDHLQLSEYAEIAEVWISNSISSSGQATFLVTQQELCRVDFDPREEKLSHAWCTVYGQETSWYVGRLGPGSGSTPTVSICGDQQVIVITDGRLPMHLMWFAAADGELIASRPVHFTKDDSQAPSTSEQSVAVDGCRAFVVQNYLGVEQLDPNITCLAARQGSAVRRRLGDYCQRRIDAKTPLDLFPAQTCPVAFGCSAFGAALYELQASDNSSAPQSLASSKGRKVDKVWVRDDISCGTSIPLISTNAESRMAYCAGLRKVSNMWGLVGLDLDTGADRLFLRFYDNNLAHNTFANPFYAGVEATGPDRVTIGSIGGVLHLSPVGEEGVGMQKLSDMMYGDKLQTESGNVHLLQNEVRAHAGNHDAQIARWQSILVGSLMIVLVGIIVHIRRHRKQVNLMSPGQGV